MRDIYHCTPSELDAQDDRIIEMHLGFMAAQHDQQFIDQQRANQRAKIKSS